MNYLTSGAQLHRLNHTYLCFYHCIHDFEFIEGKMGDWKNKMHVWDRLDSIIRQTDLASKLAQMFLCKKPIEQSMVS